MITIFMLVNTHVLVIFVTFPLKKLRLWWHKYFTKFWFEHFIYKSHKFTDGSSLFKAISFELTMLQHSLDAPEEMVLNSNRNGAVSVNWRLSIIFQVMSAFDMAGRQNLCRFLRIWCSVCRYHHRSLIYPVSDLAEWRRVCGAENFGCAEWCAMRMSVQWDRDRGIAAILHFSVPLWWKEGPNGKGGWDREVMG